MRERPKHLTPIGCEISHYGEVSQGIFAELPESVREHAREAYRQFMRDPWHPSLRFKPVHSSLPVYSVRVGKGYRAVGQRDEKGVVWFWIGSHADYDTLLSQL